MTCANKGRCLIVLGIFLTFVGLGLTVQLITTSTFTGDVGVATYAFYIGPVLMLGGIGTIISACVSIRRENAAARMTAGAVIQPYHSTVINQGGPAQPLVGGYPPPVQHGYPQQGGAGGYPPPPQQGYPPPPQQGYPPQQHSYPPPQQGYPPPQQSYPPPQQQGYPAPPANEKGGYPAPPPYEATPNAPPPE